MRMIALILAIMSAAGIASAQQPTVLDRRLAETYLEYANLVDSAYARSGRPKDTVGKFKLAVNGFTDLSSTSGFRAATYVDQESRRVVIAFAGTEPDPLKNPSGFVRDITTGAFIRVIGTPAQIRQAELLIDGIQKQNPDVQIVVAGHSLGGALAQYVAAKYGLEGYTFNSEVLSSSLSAQAMEGKILLAKPIVHIVEKGEILSQTVNRLSKVDYLGGKVTEVDYTRKFLKGGDHSLQNLIAGLGYNAFGTLGAAPSRFDSVDMALFQRMNNTTSTANSTPQMATNSNVAPSGAPTAVLNSTSQTNFRYSGAVTYATGAGTADYDTIRTFRISTWTSGGDLLKWDFTGIGQLGKGNLNGAQIVNTGSASTSEGAIYWGRWQGNTQVTTYAGATIFGQGVSYVFGDSVTALPLNKQFTYGFASGTQIVSQSGVVGNAMQSGTITVNTGTQAVQLNNLRFGFPTASAFGAALFTMNGAAKYSSTYRIEGTLTGSCSGGNCGANLASTGGFAGRFTGATGAGIALMYGAVTNNNAVGGVASAAFKR